MKGKNRMILEMVITETQDKDHTHWDAKLDWNMTIAEKVGLLQSLLDIAQDINERIERETKHEYKN